MYIHKKLILKNKNTTKEIICFFLSSNTCVYGWPNGNVTARFFRCNMKLWKNAHKVDVCF